MVGARETKNGYAFRFYGDFNRFSNRPVSVIQAIDNSFFQSLIGVVVECYGLRPVLGLSISCLIYLYLLVYFILFQNSADVGTFLVIIR